MKVANAVTPDELFPDQFPKSLNAEVPQVIVEVGQAGRQDDGFDPGPVRAVSEMVADIGAGPVIVANDIEPPKGWREQDGGEMSGRQSCRHVHVRQDTSEG